MTSPEDLRIGDREREEAMAALREHYAQGRLTNDELDERLGTALTARTGGDLRRITADLPTLGRRAHDRQRPEPFRPGYIGPKPFEPRYFGPHFGAHLGPDRFGRRPMRRSRPPILFAVLAFGLIASLVGGIAWPLFFLVRALLIVWLVFIVAGVLRHRRHHGHGPWH
ncbi:MAG TPA: DUF1707 domain-containing protein [Thermopolyspora sp.]|jgi:Domain of unknown function (DUF1707).